jgi:hypothetical protein
LIQEGIGWQKVLIEEYLRGRQGAFFRDEWRFREYSSCGFDVSFFSARFSELDLSVNDSQKYGKSNTIGPSPIQKSFYLNH